MQSSEPDSLYSWFIASVCNLIFIIMNGASQLSAMLFVACMERFNANREQASFPFVLSTVFQALSGVFAGYLSSKFGIRGVVALGSILSSIGIGACFFAEDIITVAVLWGLVYGVGFGLATLILPAIINSYFFKHRAKALGLLYLGSPLGFFIFPPIFEALYNFYGLSGTFLMLSCIVMHCIPLSLLLKRPNFKQDSPSRPLNACPKQNSYSEVNLKFKSGILSKLKGFDPEESKSVPGVYTRKTSLKLTGGIDSYLMIHEKNAQANVKSSSSCTDFPTLLKVSNGTLTSKCNHHSGEDVLFYNNLGKNSSSGNDINSKTPGTQDRYTWKSDECISKSEQNLPDNKVFAISVDTPYNSQNPLYTEPSETTGVLASRKTTSQTKDGKSGGDGPTSLSNFISLCLNPLFIIIYVTTAIFNLEFVTVATIITDFSRDIGVSVIYEKYILMCLALSGAFGMMGFGWVTDGGYMSRTSFTALCFIASCALLPVFPWTTNLVTLIVVLSAWSIPQSNIPVIIPAIIGEYFDEDIQEVAISSSYVLSGPVNLVIPIIIGYFRDNKGSYSSIFFLLSGLSFISSLSFLALPVIAKCKAKSKL